MVGGELVVTLHDTARDHVATLGEREWVLLSQADGTRDPEGILAAARREGRQASRDNLEAFLGQLAAAGMLTEGPSMPPAGEDSPPAGDERDRRAVPVRAMPGLTLRCHGGGTCCRLYPTTVFSPAEVTTALHHAGGREEERFTPERGSERLPWRGRAVTMVEGRCHYLADDGRCRLHAIGGPEAKPRGCRRYPVQLVSDGRELRVAVAPECACVFDSALDEAADAVSLRDRSATDLDLDEADFVAELPVRIVMSASTAVRRDAFTGWCDARAEAFAQFEGDAARWLWAEAERLAHGSEDAAPDRAPERDEVERRRLALVDALDRRIALARWRSADDLASALPRWLRAALDRSVSALIAEAATAPDERFFVRALLFARDPAQSASTVEEALRRRAMQIWVARHLHGAMAGFDGAREDPAAHRPLALVAGYARAFGL